MHSLDEGLAKQLGIVLSRAERVHYAAVNASGMVRALSAMSSRANGIKPPVLLAKPGDTRLEDDRLKVLRAVFARHDPAVRAAMTAWLLDNVTDNSASLVTHAVLELAGGMAARSLVENQRQRPAGVRVTWECINEKLENESSRFNDAELDAVDSLRQEEAAGRVAAKRGHKSLPGPPDAFRGTLSRTADLIAAVRYARLREAVLDGFNPEINEDKGRLVSRMSALGFRAEIATALNKLDRDIAGAHGPHEQKACMDLTRTIFEEIVEDAAKAAASKKSIPLAPGPNLKHFATYKNTLIQVGVLNSDEEKLAQSLYNYLSNSGTHSLVSTVEQVRVTKNMVIETCLLVVGRVQNLK